MSIAKDLKNYVLTYKPNVIAFVDNFPADFDEALCFYHDGGNDADHIFHDEGNINHKFLNVLARSKDPSTAIDLLDDVSDILEHTVLNKYINEIWYTSIHHRTGGETKIIGQDERGRFTYIVRFQVNFQSWSKY